MQIENFDKKYSVKDGFSLGHLITTFIYKFLFLNAIYTVSNKIQHYFNKDLIGQEKIVIYLGSLFNQKNFVIIPEALQPKI